MYFFFLFAVFAFALFSTVYCTINLQISNGDISPDGYSRRAVLVNNGYPGPLIYANKGDLFEINVEDNLTDTELITATSIHWHGLNQNGTSEADGATFVTQCPITPNNSFEYSFSTDNQAGTFWYHSHLAVQYCDGLKGPLIIYDPHDPYLTSYDVDNADTVITMSDWYHSPTTEVQVPAIADSTLINGHGRYPGGPASPLAEINVQAGLRYRLRLINMACEANFVFSIDGHTFTVIEADGVNTEPVEVDSLQIFAAQRYSVIMTANQPVGNYWIRALPSQSRSATTNGGLNSAILHYAGAPDAEPTSVQPSSTMPLLETNLHSLTDQAAPGKPEPGGADVNINLDFNFGKQFFTINGVQFVPPSVPVLLQILSGARTAQELLPQGSVYTLPPNKVIEVSIPPNVHAVGGPHPFHLHGHEFWVVRSANSTVYNYENPVRRDTVSTGVFGDNVTVRFVTDNAGPWFFHCHIDWHLQLGLAVVFAEDTQTAGQHTQVSDAWNNLCPKYQKLLDNSNETSSAPR